MDIPLLDLACMKQNLPANSRLADIFVSDKHYTAGLFVLVNFHHTILIDPHNNVFLSL